MRSSLLVIAGTNLLLTANWLAVIVLARHLHASSAAIGLVFSLLGVGALLGSVMAGWMQRHMSPSWIVLGVTWMWAMLLPCYALGPQPLLLGVLNVPMGAGGGSLNVVLMSQLQLQTPDDLQGRAMSATFLISWAAIPVGSILAGFLVQALGPSNTIMVLAAAMVALTCAATINPAIRNPAPIAEAQPV
jgi:predicted MFS family arabinose efflux permease